MNLRFVQSVALLTAVGCGRSTPPAVEPNDPKPVGSAAAPTETASAAAIASATAAPSASVSAAPSASATPSTTVATSASAAPGCRCWHEKTSPLPICESSQLDYAGKKCKSKALPVGPLPPPDLPLV